MRTLPFKLSFLLNISVILSVPSCKSDLKRYHRSTQYIVNDTIHYADFNIRFEGNKVDNVFSSSDSLFSRDYLSGTKQIKTALTACEKRSIYKAVKEADFYSMPDTIPEGGDCEHTCIVPAFSEKVVVTIGKHVKSVYYSGTCDICDKEIANRYKKVFGLVQRIIYRKKEILQMRSSDKFYL